MIAVRPGPVDGPGLYDLPADVYHADPCPEPSLSHTIAREIHERSPLHAKRRHPRFGGKPRTPTADMNLGSAVHALAFGKGAALARIDAENYRTKDAQNARDVAHAQGFIPLLAKEYEHAEYMASCARPVIELVLGAPIQHLVVETAAIANEDGIWLRSLIDAATPDLSVVLDWKTCAQAAPDVFAGTVRKYYATQAAFYDHTLSLLDGRTQPRRFIFAAQERDHPDAITLHELDPAALEIAQAQMGRVRAKWGECLRTNVWPCYDPGPHLVSPTSWEMDAEIAAQFEEHGEYAG